VRTVADRSDRRSFRTQENTMRNPVRTAAAAEFSSKAAGAANTTLDASRVAGNDAQFAPVDAIDGADALDAWARRAMAANGFGSADLATAARAAAHEGVGAGAAAARASLREILHAIGAALGECVRGALARRRARRDLRRTVAVLRELDPRTLRDIGVTESEAGSIAAELHGLAERTRARVLIEARRM
jgi:uncharacterized protein YjiS (DUF1127 family)